MIWLFFSFGGIWNMDLFPRGYHQKFQLLYQKNDGTEPYTAILGVSFPFISLICTAYTGEYQQLPVSSFHTIFNSTDCSITLFYNKCFYTSNSSACVHSQLYYNIYIYILYAYLHANHAIAERRKRTCEVSAM